jgi:hypothetical protein
MKSLKQLSDEATRGPWTIEDSNWDDLQSPTRFNGPCVVYAAEDCDVHPVADFTCNHSCRLEDDCVANAAFVTELVNRYRAGLLVEVQS